MSGQSPLHGNLTKAALIAALERIESTGTTGSLRIDTGDGGGALFFDRGRLYFGTIDGHALTTQELNDAGIDRSLWQAGAARPEARGNFVRELIALGCHRDAVARFVRNRLVLCLTTFAAAESGTFGPANGRHGFGTEVSFAPSELLPELLVDLDIHADTLVSLKRTRDDEVTVDRDVWNTIVTMVTPQRFEELTKSVGATDTKHAIVSLEQRGLLTLIQSESQPAERRRSEHQPPTFAPKPVQSSPADWGAPEPHSAQDSTDTDDEEYVPDKVGRQTYATIASLRASRTEPPPQEKARALRRLIEAVRGL